MTQHQKNIFAFNAKIAEQKGETNPVHPITPDSKTRQLWVKLIAEELIEFCVALDVDLQIGAGEVTVLGGRGPYNQVEAYDGLLDMDYLVTGAAVALGQDMELGQAEVHRSNMSKFIDGHLRADGKWVKGPSYSPAVLAPILEAQMPKES